MRDKEQQKEYRQKNRKHIKDYSKEYQQRNREHLKEYGKEYRQRNREYIKEQQKEYWQRNKGYLKEQQKKCYYKKTYNLTLEEADKILLIQNYRCPICGKSLIETRRCIDHNSKTGKVRGILCSKCNLGLGHFNDDLELLKKTIEYIKE